MNQVSLSSNKIRIAALVTSLFLSVVVGSSMVYAATSTPSTETTTGKVAPPTSTSKDTTVDKVAAPTSKTDDTNAKVTPPPTTASDPKASSGGKPSDVSFSIKNPIKFATLEDLIVGILNVIIVIATPVVIIFIILAGFKYVTARGNPSEIQEATRALTYAIIGGVLIIGAVAIAQIIKNLVSAFAA